MTPELYSLIKKGQDFKIKSPVGLFKIVKRALQYEMHRKEGCHNHFKKHFLDVVNYNQFKTTQSDYVDYLKYSLFAEVNPKGIKFFWGSTPEEQDIIQVEFLQDKITKTANELKEDFLLEMLSQIEKGVLTLTVLRKITPGFFGIVPYQVSNGYILNIFVEANSFDYIDSIINLNQETIDPFEKSYRILQEYRPTPKVCKEIYQLYK